MKDLLKLILLAGMTALLATSCYRDDLENLQKQIDQLKTGEIATIDTQIGSIKTSINDLKNVDGSLKDYIQALQKDGEKYGSEIVELQKIDDEVIARIDDLEKYVDVELKNTKDWVNATFATLEQFDSLSEVVAGISSRIDILEKDLDDSIKELTAGYKRDIQDAVTTLEGKMKKWVSEQLTGYYTIAQTDAKLDSLSKAHDDADIALQKEIDDQKAALQKAKTDITGAYKQAIKEAIETLEGKINTKIATDIAVASKALQDQIDSIMLEIEGIKGRLNNAESRITTIEEQIKAINSSIQNLENVDKEIKGYISALQKDGDKYAKEIEELKKMDEQIIGKIDELKKYVDNSLKQTVNWIKGTYATLEQYNELTMTVAMITARLNRLSDDLDNITEAYTEAIRDAVSSLETSMKNWVNEKLTDYYTIAQIDAKLASMSTKDEDLQKQIEAQAAALKKAKTDITAAYKQAIKEAIETLEGKINTKIAADIANAKEALQIQIDAINNEITGIKLRLDEAESRLNTIDEQIEAINKSIQDLEDVDEEIKGYISALQKDGVKYAKQIEALQKMDEQIIAKIDALKKYVDDELEDMADWVNGTFATLDQYDDLCTVVAGLSADIDQLALDLDTAKTDLTAAYTQAIQNAITTLETSMKSWVNDKLTGYYTIAQIDAKIAALNSTDDGLQDQIDAQVAALQQAKTDITAAYKQAIKQAIETLEGKINTKIAADIATATQALQNQIDAINTEITGIKKRLDEAEENIDALINRIQSIVVVPYYTDGSVMATADEDELSFDIKPASVAQSLADAWQSMTAAQRIDAVKINIVEVHTKSADPAADIKNVKFVNGKLVCTVKFSNLPEHAAASLQIAHGSSNIASQYFNIYYYDPDPSVVFTDGSVTEMLFMLESNSYMFRYSYDEDISNFVCEKILVNDTDVTAMYEDYFATNKDGQTFTFFFAGDGRLFYDAYKDRYACQGGTPPLQKFKVNGANIISKLSKQTIPLTPVSIFDENASLCIQFKDSNNYGRLVYHNGVFSTIADHSENRILGITKGSGNTLTISFASSGSVETGTIVIDADAGTFLRTGDTPAISHLSVDGENLLNQLSEKARISTGIDDLNNTNGNW